MKEQVEIGQPITYVDHHGVPRPALVTQVWGECRYDDDGKLCNAPCINIVCVSLDEKKDDSWGRQVERDSSVVHEMDQQAHGNFWRF